MSSVYVQPTIQEVKKNQRQAYYYIAHTFPLITTVVCMNFWFVNLQMFPVAVTCGNTFILKPSEKDPGNAIAVYWTDL